jgi:drug/metabolite transporter (DMT)-like permease
MSSNVSVSSRSTLSTLAKLPWMLIVVVFLIAAHYFQVPFEGTVAYTFIGVALAVLFIEMFKSGDVSAVAFFMDQFWAVLSVMLASALLTYLYFVEGQEPNFYHWIGFAIIIADALLNPFNAFRTALRNFDVAG